jgi:hypothetical protein
MTTNELDGESQNAAASGADQKWFEIEPGVRFRVLLSTLQTGGAFACLECIAQPGTGSPLQVHHNVV